MLDLNVNCHRIIYGRMTLCLAIYFSTVPYNMYMNKARFEMIFRIFIDFLYKIK